MIVRRLPSYLCHHGIKNQHWGVRNGPPYPLDRKTSNAIKRGKNETRHEGKKVGTSHSAAAAGTYYTRPAYKIEEMPWGEFHKQPMSYKEKYRETDLGLKEVNKYADGNFRNALESDDIRTLLESNFKDDRYKNATLTINDVQKRRIRENGFEGGYERDLLNAINQWSTDRNTQEASNNCSKCSDMVELVQRGMNPMTFSAGRSKFGMLSSATAYHWDGAVVYKEKSYANIENKIKSFGNHGSGTIGIRRSDGSGHSMHFTVIKGRVEVQDGQNGRVYHTIQEALKAESHDPNQFCHITRLDQATPNVKHMIEDSVVRMDNRGNNSKIFPSGVQFKNGGSGNIWINDFNTMSNSITKNGEYDKEKSNDYYSSRSSRK